MSLATDQIENQAESHRANISELIDELRNRVTPGEVIDQFLGWDEGHEIARNFGRQVTNNPLSLALIGTGVAWLMFSDGSQRRNGNAAYQPSEAGNGAMESAKSGARAAAGAISAATDYASSTADSLGTTVSDAGARLSSVADSALDSAKQAVSDVSRGAQSAYARAKDSVAAAGDTVSTASDRVASTASSAWDKATGLTQEQPMLVAGLGFALGMALGAILPPTEAENSLLGEKSAALKEKAGELAEEGYEKAKAVAQKGYEAATDAATQEAQNQGLTAKEAKSSVYTPQHETSSTDEVQPRGSTNGGDHGSGADARH